MNLANVNMLNAIVLVAVGAWGVFGAVSASPIYMIPLFGGTVLFVLTNSLRFYNKIVNNIALGLTLVLTALAIYFFIDSLGKINSTPLLRAGLVIISSLISLVFFGLERRG